MRRDLTRNSRRGMASVLFLAASTWLIYHGVEAAVSQGRIASVDNALKQALDADSSSPSQGFQTTSQKIRPHSSKGKRTLLQNEELATVDADDFQCGLAPQQIRRILDDETRSWFIDSRAWNDISNDLQAIVNCTQPDDILLFSVEDALSPVGRVTIPWNLTLSSSLRTAALENDVIPETATKTTFTCLPNQGLFYLRSRDVRFANLVFEDCSLREQGDRGIIEAEECLEGQTEGSLTLHHVTFRNNLLDGTTAVIAASCMTVEMVDVIFTRNECSGVCFGELSLENSLRDVKIRRNEMLMQSRPIHALLYLPPGSTTEASQLSVRQNQMTTLYVDGGALSLEDSVLRSNAGAPVVVLQQGRRIAFRNCLLTENEASGAAGAALYSNGTQSLRLRESNFTSNSAERGGAVATVDSQVDIRDCQVTLNSARDTAGALAVTGGSIELLRTVLTNNTASLSGGALAFAGTTSSTLLDLSCANNEAVRGGCLYTSNATELRISQSAIVSNSAGFGGGMAFENVPSVVLADMDIQQNQASEEGGGIWLQSCGSIEIFNTSIRESSVGRTGGGLSCNVCQNLTVIQTSFMGNRADLDGGGAYVARSQIFLTETDWRDNHATVRGGGFLAVRSNASCENSVFLSNRGSVGGGFELTEGNAVVSGCSFTGNVAAQAGGGIEVTYGTLNLQNSSIQQNFGHRGAGVDVLTSYAEVYNTQFFRNVAHTSRGGGLAGHLSNMTLANLMFDSNSAAGSGGAIDMAICQEVEGHNLTVVRNSCRRMAGGIGVYDHTVFNLTQSAIRNNTAGESGGGIFESLNATLRLSRCSVNGNSARNGGGISSSRNSSLYLENSTVAMNIGTDTAGGVYSHESRLVATQSIFSNNSAVRHGGSLYSRGSQVSLSESIISGNSALRGAGLYGIENSSVVVSGSEVFRNQAELDGGFMLLEDSLAEVRDTVISQNSASDGGVFFLTSSDLSIEGSAFIENAATRSGGTVDAHKNNSVTISDTSFVNESAESGGALWLAQSNLTASGLVVEDCRAERDGGFSFLEDSAAEVTESLFTRNSASVGGAFLLKNSSLATETAVFIENRATLAGGSIAANGNNSVSIGETSFVNGSAQSGAAIWLEQSNLTAIGLMIEECQATRDGGGILANASSFVFCRDCSFRGNVGHYGGAVALESMTAQSIAFHFDSCHFRENNASLGGLSRQPDRSSELCRLGALHVLTPRQRVDCREAASNCTCVALTGCRFIQNKADVSGGAIFSRHPHVPRYSCSSQPRLVPAAAARGNALRSLQHLSDPESSCTQWRRNAAGRYGDTAGSYAWEARGYVVLDDSYPVRIPNGFYTFSNHKSGDPLPILLVELLDGYGQGPPVGDGDVSVQATVRVADGFFVETPTITLDESRNGFPPISGFQQPGSHTVVVYFSESGIDSIVLVVQLRSCRIGEHVAGNGSLCVTCSGAQYNFRVDSEECAQCPERGNCTSKNVIHPMPGYWHRTPCSTHIQECVSEEACAYRERETKLENVTKDLDTCRLKPATVGLYLEAQCKEGYKDVLCGSCKDGYGRSQSSRCADCYEHPGSFSVFVLSLIVLFLLSCFCIKSNMHDTVTSVSQLSRPRRSERGALSYRRRQLASGPSVPVNFQMVEMLTTGHVPPEVLEPGGAGCRSKAVVTEDAMTAKNRFVEIFKITVNFLQSIAVAVSINTNWNSWMRSLLSIADFVGGATTDSIVLSIDCLFSSDAETPRSVLRTITFFLVPMALLLIFVSFWTVATRRHHQNSNYLASRCLLSGLVVFYLTYVSCTKTAVNTLYCIPVHDSVVDGMDSTTRRWAMDTSVVCYQGSHAALAGLLAWPLLLLISIGFPISVVYLLLKLRANEGEGQQHIKEAASFLYRAYRGPVIYWESVIMLRKALLAVIAVLGYPLGVNVQGILAVCVLMLAGYLQTVCLPFKEQFSELNGYEVASLIVSQLTFVSALIFNDDRTKEPARIAMTVVVTLCIVSLVLFLASQFLNSVGVYVKSVLELEGFEETEEWSTIQCLHIYAMALASDYYFRLFPRRPRHSQDVRGTSSITEVA